MEIEQSEPVRKLRPEEVSGNLKSVSGWGIIQESWLKKDFRFPDFASALRFVNQVGELAETEGHHPEINLVWGKVELVLWTHSVDGLSWKDFRFARLVDNLRIGQ